MPTYEFHCPGCGRFDLRRDMRQATDPASCPSCGQASRRVYTVPGGGSRSGPLWGLSRSEAARVDRARSGEPVVTGPPTGRRLPRARPHSH